ncbi:MAG: hypothetical protein QOC59_614 [Microbacteriaceae bacterium]|nr:hypothetical protein [Microbacteriaceae bacterium]
MTAPAEGLANAARAFPVRACAIVLVAIVAHAGGASAAVGAHRTAAVKRTQELVLLLTTHVAVSAPGASPSTGEPVPASRPITREQTTLPVVGRATTAAGFIWLHVMLPGRPNGRRAWIEKRGTVLTTSHWHILVRTAIRRVLVYRDGKLDRSFPAVVGKPSTPTPHGQFFVEESVRMLPGAAGAPFALALSARSNALQEFEGGPGQIAIHGLNGLVGVPGTAVSHGCVRLTDHDIRWLATRITTGVTVTIAF